MFRDGCAALPRAAIGLSAVLIVVFTDHTHLLFPLFTGHNTTEWEKMESY